MQILCCEHTPIGLLEYGVGFNWYDGFGLGEPDNVPTYPNLEDKAGWTAVKEAMDDLSPGFIRFGVPPDHLLGEKPGTLQKDSVHLHRLEWVAKWAESNGCNILLDTWSIPRRYQFPEPPNFAKTQKYASMAAEDNKAFAQEFVLPLLQHVMEERKLNAVRLYNPFNEPLQYGPYQTPGNAPDAYVHYVDMFKEIRRALTSSGLCPEKIRMAGVDCIHPDRFPALEMLARGVDIDPYLDCYTIHFYFHRFDWMHPVPFLGYTLHESIDRQTAALRRYCSRRGKPLLAAEVGWYPQEGDPLADVEGSARHFAALMTSETMIRGMNVGVCGFAIWSLFNPNNFDGHWRVIAVRNGELWKAPNLYATYRLFTRFARPGSEIYPLRPNPPERPWQYVHGTVLKRPDGKLVLYAVNDNLVESRPAEFLLPTDWADLAFSKYIKDDIRPGECVGEVTSKLEGEAASIKDRLMPMSLTVYMQK